MKPLIYPVLAAFSLLAAPLQAEQDQPVVVELFTSQGCSSCPAADEMLAELADREDIIALALHVDYWDYIGWEDPFGDPAHAERQRGYAAVGGRRSVYTPELIVQGQTDIVGAKPMKLMDAVERHAEAAPQVALTLARSGETLEIKAAPLTDAVGPMHVHMLRYSPMERTKVTRGENAGHVMEHSNVVRGWQVLADWDGSAPLSLTAKTEGDLPVVVIVQRQEPGGPGAILAAARIK
ncbi:DUF1223 domain-containing protein [Sulfitobacter sp. W002]|uniref:DUF1223 domain-containing protein n=1 Tax=Sulfitobacter sp. W002 TaxID=2867024 RepID=UPI0021A95589|nr:DUF1223 domain-containing protein [Sulfitobacter sp. W002]UWR31262.1 DUF1223 domain-containing protein [Sulfitobacter sp. W002]